VGTGFSASVEGFLDISRMVMFGLGFEYQVSRALQDPDFAVDFNPSVSYIPIYLLGKASLPLMDDVAVEGYLNLGYSVFAPNSDYIGEDIALGGLYLGLGLGMSYRNYILTLGYKSSSGWIDADFLDEPISTVNGQIGISLGYRLLGRK